jgi:plasmid maintenance system killer protein
MIQSFKDKDSAAFFQGRRVRRFEGFAARAQRWLSLLHTATSLVSQAINWNSYMVIGKDNTASVSTINGVCASSGKTMAHMTLKSWIITESLHC